MNDSIAEISKETPCNSIDDFFFVAEVDSADRLVGDLFRRRFNTSSFPDYPHHYVAFAVLPDKSLLTLGYVHYTFWEGAALCGGLVIDERNFRRLPSCFRHSLKRAGGIAELLLRNTFARLPDSIAAIWGHVGDKQSERVCLRVGFQRTNTEYVMVVWRASVLTESDKREWVRRVSELGAF